MALRMTGGARFPSVPGAATVRQRVTEIASVAVFDQPRLIELAQQAQASSIVILWTLIVLTMTIAALFVSTVLSRSVAERRLEFATLRAIGISSRTVLLTVGAEAALVSVLAMLAGAALSLLLGWPLNALAAPASNVDTLYVADLALFEAVFGLLKNAHQRGHPIVVVTHDPDVTRETDRRLEIRDGRLRPMS
jgi:predicted lysophospholipase L1 biosynthesis ABC-type transport system permease subunit